VLVTCPNAFCQESATSFSVSIYVNVDDIEYEEGKLTQSYFNLNLDANKSFCVLIFSPSTDYSTRRDERTSYSEGWYSLSQEYFPRGLELRFSYDEIICEKEILEYGILFGVNITTIDYTEDPLSVKASLSSPLRSEWEINGTIKEVTPEEGAPYTVYGLPYIEKAMKDYDLKELFLLKIQITREVNSEQALLLLPPIAMFVLLLASLLLIWKNDLSNSLKVYLAVAFPAITYLTYLKEITPPVLTFVEKLTVIDIILCFLFAIAAVFICVFRERIKKWLHNLLHKLLHMYNDMYKMWTIKRKKREQ
jgi:hypothetical protein